MVIHSIGTIKVLLLFLLLFYLRSFQADPDPECISCEFGQEIMSILEKEPKKLVIKITNFYKKCLKMLVFKIGLSEKSTLLSYVWLLKTLNTCSMIRIGNADPDRVAVTWKSCLNIWARWRPSLATPSGVMCGSCINIITHTASRHLTQGEIEPIIYPLINQHQAFNMYYMYYRRLFLQAGTS